MPSLVYGEREEMDIPSIVQIQWRYTLGIALVQKTCIAAAGNEKATQFVLS